MYYQKYYFRKYFDKENNIVICEYSLLPANRIQIREFDFNELLYPDNEIFRDDLKLLVIYLKSRKHMIQ